MLRSALGAAATLALLCAPAVAGCGEDFIQTITPDGQVIVLGGGSIWRVDMVDTVYSMLWLPATTVIVCETADGLRMRKAEDVPPTESVHVERLR